MDTKNTHNLRPGVYTDYTLFKAEHPFIGKSVGIIGVADSDDNKLSVCKITDLNSAVSLYGEDADITVLIKTILDNAYCDIYAISVSQGKIAEYKISAEKLLSDSPCYCLISDYNPEQLVLHIKNYFKDHRIRNKVYISTTEEIDITSGNVGTDNVAIRTNFERICFTYPKVTIPFSQIDVSNALLASMISRNVYPEQNLFSESANGKYFLKYKLTESEKNSLLYNGISVFEYAGVENRLELMRCVTSKTRGDDGEYDTSCRDISVIASLDAVTTKLDLSLKSLIRERKAVTADMINSTVIYQLVNLKQLGLISAYRAPKVYYDDNDSTACIVELAVTLKQTANQIYLNLNISA